jgi:hypothetical protein
VGKRLRKKALLSEIQRERRALDDSLALLSTRQMTKAGVTRGGWSVRKSDGRPHDGTIISMSDAGGRRLPWRLRHGLIRLRRCGGCAATGSQR